jgi:hypothetical protein
VFNRKRKPYTEDEWETVGVIKATGCVCCDQLPTQDRTYMTVEFNHHKRGNKRIGNDIGTGECEWHHRGVCLPGFQRRTMTLLFGPSRADGTKPFHARFGSDNDLLERQEAMLRGRTEVCEEEGP